MERLKKITNGALEYPEISKYVLLVGLPREVLIRLIHDTRCINHFPCIVLVFLHIAACSLKIRVLDFVSV